MNKQCMALAVAATLALAGMELHAKTFFQLEESEQFEAYPYAGIGLSYTFLNPEKEGSTLFKVSDDKSTGFYLRGGYRWRERWSAEFTFFDLGEAGIGSSVPGQNQGGGITYEALSVNANYHFGQNYFDWGTFAKIGLASIKNDKTKDFIPFEEDKKFAIHTGLAVTRLIQDNWFFRFDVDFFSRDAEALSVGIQKHFIKQKQAQPQDSDKDGVYDSQDQCPQTLPGKKVDAVGCAIPEPVKEEVIEKAFESLDFKGIGFEVASATLTQGAMAILDETARVLLANPGVNIEIQAHTDSDGSRAFNQKLSQSRAQSVLQYLETKGVPSETMEANGYGEDQPIADNTSAEGKAANRRVEIKVKEQAQEENLIENSVEQTPSEQEE